MAGTAPWKLCGGSEEEKSERISKYVCAPDSAMYYGGPISAVHGLASLYQPTTCHGAC